MNLIQGQNATQCSEVWHVCDKTWDNALKNVSEVNTLINARENRKDAVVYVATILTPRASNYYGRPLTEIMRFKNITIIYWISIYFISIT